MSIDFYSPRDRFGCFSNFSPHGIRMEGQWWPTVEHYYQAQKFASPARQERIRRAKTPKEAKSLGSDRTGGIRPDWDLVKDEVMYRAVLAKFGTHRGLRGILLGTGDETLVESSVHDYYWGCGGDGTGENRLGKILMRVRMELRRLK